jgi:uncharacterized protein YvpB
MDEEKGHEFAFVQLPQHYNNITKNDLYGNSLLAISEVLENKMKFVLIKKSLYLI